MHSNLIHILIFHQLDLKCTSFHKCRQVNTLTWIMQNTYLMQYLILAAFLQNSINEQVKCLFASDIMKLDISLIINCHIMKMAKSTTILEIYIVHVLCNMFSLYNSEQRDNMFLNSCFFANSLSLQDFNFEGMKVRLFQHNMLCLHCTSLDLQFSI